MPRQRRDHKIMKQATTVHWSEALSGQGPDESTARSLVAQLTACEAEALSFCRLLERWARGDAVPTTSSSPFWCGRSRVSARRLPWARPLIAAPSGPVSST